MSSNTSPLTIALLSGGLDSATAVGIAIESGHQVIGYHLIMDKGTNVN